MEKNRDGLGRTIQTYIKQACQAQQTVINTITQKYNRKEQVNQHQAKDKHFLYRNTKGKGGFPLDAKRKGMVLLLANFQ